MLSISTVSKLFPLFILYFIYLLKNVYSLHLANFLFITTFSTLTISTLYQLLLAISSSSVTAFVVNHLGLFQLLTLAYI